MEKIAIFSGNRADFGILFPLIYSLNNYYQIEMILSGAHVLKQWETRKNVERQLHDNNIYCNITEVSLEDDKGTYKRCLSEIYLKIIDFFEINNDIQIAIVLGDRIEAAAFALGTFYSQIPLLHICGGDVAAVFNYDNSIRHSISKIANYHFVTNERSRNILLQMGEEEQRVFNIGNLSYDYERLGFLTPAEELGKTYGFTLDDVIAVYTYHPACDKTKEENFKEFKYGLEASIDSEATKIFVTYPNNDPGYEQILHYINSLSNNRKVLCINSLGTDKYLSLMKNYKTIVVGNSSSGLLETTLYCVPVLNIGERQNGRSRGCNVIDVPADYSRIKISLNDVIQNYNVLKDRYIETKYIFGDGSAAIKAKKYIGEILKLPKAERLFKKFVER